ncbi:hypothetical protein [Niabella drilacis]|uniref:Uncharacterized protein n=1 Tax=Niabella drilacis (strain DSM 25811 / CCM 8410 / CCUG 62505 / LMG 26954 / E90) TaxID=1285928 RepID=A0A1G6UQV3_NIADE|nr:hypothetical protein [Niabella drilacis]SDD43653.1 hypothetical protein SAMN04487894_10960 [Niabella drilacis]
MENNRNNERIVSLQLSNDEAIVLLEWLINFNQEEHSGLFEDQSEKRALWNLEALLEKNVTEILNPDYLEILAKARERLRDDA